MIAKEEILNACQAKLTENQFIVDCKVSNDFNIIVYVDDINGITIDACKRISRALEAKLNDMIENFSLEISSPGLTNPFKVLKQYIKNIGNNVEIILKDGQKLEGKLLDANEDKIILEISEINNKKQIVTEEIEIFLNNIKSTKNLISFK